MALRSLLRKMPALGLKSPPMGHALNALSPSAGSRLLSHGAPIDRLENLMKVYRRERALSSASIDVTMRLYELDLQSLMKKLDIAEKACGAVLIACPLSIVLMMISHVI